MDLFIDLAVLLLIAAYLFLIRPAPVSAEVRRRFAGHYAHRGLHDLAAGVPENSRLAFELAVAGGYGSELDIQLSRDGQVVVFHDDALDRLCGRTGRLGELDWATIAQLKLLGTDHTPPLLTDVLAMVAGRTPLIIELKTGPDNAALCRAAWELLQRYQGPYCIESFDPFIVAWFRRHAPAVIRGQLAARFGPELPSPFRRIVLTNLLLNVIARPHFIAYCYPHRGNPSFQLTRRLFGVLTAAWTVRSLATEQELHGDYDMIIFEQYRPKEAD